MPQPERTQPTKLGGRDNALKPGRIKTQDVAVPEWGATYRVKALNGAERDSYELSVMQGKGKNQEVNIRNARAKLIILCVVDETGGLVFSPADIPALGQQPASAVQRIFDVAKKLSGLSDDDFDELTEGFETGQQDASASA